VTLATAMVTGRPKTHSCLGVRGSGLKLAGLLGGLPPGWLTVYLLAA
jgi:hypothetical protein